MGYRFVKLEPLNHFLMAMPSCIHEWRLAVIIWLSDPKRPVRTIVWTIDQQSGRGFVKPGSVRQ